MRDRTGITEIDRVGGGTVRQISATQPSLFEASQISSSNPVCYTNCTIIMAPHAIKRRKLSPLSSEGYRRTSNPQERAGDLSQNSSDHDTNTVPSNGAIQGSSTRVEAKRRTTTSWNSGIYDSNMFKLKVNELLAKVRPDYEGRMLKVENSLRKLKDIIERIPDREAKPVCTLTFSSFTRQMSEFCVDTPSGTRTIWHPQSPNPISLPPPRKGRKVYSGLLQASEHQCSRQLCTQDSYTNRRTLRYRSGDYYAFGETTALPIRAHSPYLMRTKAHFSGERLSKL